MYYSQNYQTQQLVEAMVTMMVMAMGVGIVSPVMLQTGSAKIPKVVITELEGHISAYIPSERASADLSEMELDIVTELGLPPGKWYWFNRIINQSGKPRLGSLLLDKVLSYCKDKNYRILNQVQPYGKLSRSELERWYLSRGFIALDYKKYGNLILIWPKNRSF